MRRTLLLVPLALGGLLTACGGGSGSPASAKTPATTVAPATSTPANNGSTGNGATGNGATGNGGRFGNLTPDQQQQLQAYEQCLAAHGAPNGGRFGGFGGGGNDNGNGNGANASTPPTSDATPPSTIDRQAMQAAQQACEAQRPSFIGQGGQGGGANGQFGQAVRAYLSCLSDHGVKVPDLGTVPQGSTPPTTAAGQSGQSGQNGQGGRGGFGGGGAIGQAMQQVRSDPNFATADATCKVLLPANTPGQAPAGAPTTTNG
jgi:hypothetical protein